MGLGGGLDGAVHRAATLRMGGAGGLGVRPCSCRAGLRAVGLPRRGAFRRHSCCAGMGSAALGHCPCGTGPETACPRRTRRRRIGCAGGRHIAVGMPGSRGHRASPGLLGPSAAPGSVCPSAAGMILLSGCLGRIFLPGAGLLGGALLAGAVVGIPAAATRSAEVLGAVPGSLTAAGTAPASPDAKEPPGLSPPCAPRPEAGPPLERPLPRVPPKRPPPLAENREPNRKPPPPPRRVLEAEAPFPKPRLPITLLVA